MKSMSRRQSAIVSIDQSPSIFIATRSVMNGSTASPALDSSNALTIPPPPRSSQTSIM
jgi:hypothetical protein